MENSNGTTAVVTGPISTQDALETVAAAATEAVAADAVAAKTEEIKAPEADRQAAKFAAISRREKALKAQERALSARAKELEAQIAAAKEASGKVDDTKYIDVESFKRNPYQYIKQHGLTMEQVAEIVLNDGKETPEMLAKQVETKLEKQIRELQEKIAAKETQDQEDKYAQVLDGFKADMNAFVTNTADYEMIRATESVELVYDVIETNFNNKIEEFEDEHGRAPSMEERRKFILDNKTACDMVEAWLFDQEKAKIDNLRKLNKTKGMFEPAAPKATEPTVKTATTTLTNTLAAQVPSKGGKTLTDEESKREAAKLIKWNT